MVRELTIGELPTDELCSQCGGEIRLDADDEAGVVSLCDCGSVGVLA